MRMVVTDNRFEVVNPRYAPSRFWRAFVHSRVVLRIFVRVFKMLFQLRVRNAEIVPLPGTYIAAANHGSHYDLFLALAIFRNLTGQMPVFAVWDGAYEIPVISGILKAIPCITVDTRPGHDAERMGSLREMIAHLRAGRSLIIGSEGERRDHLGDFEGGAALLSLHTGVKVVPISLRGVQGLFKDLWWPDRFRGKVEVIFHAPLDPADFEKGGGSRAEQIQRLTKAIHDAVAADLDYAVKRAPAEAGHPG